MTDNTHLPYVLSRSRKVRTPSLPRLALQCSFPWPIPVPCVLAVSLQPSRAFSLSRIPCRTCMILGAVDTCASRCICQYASRAIFLPRRSSRSSGRLSGPLSLCFPAPPSDAGCTATGRCGSVHAVAPCGCAYLWVRAVRTRHRSPHGTCILTRCVLVCVRSRSHRVCHRRYRQALDARASVAMTLDMRRFLSAPHIYG